MDELNDPREFGLDTHVGDAKISHAVADKFALGIESYDGLGDVRRIGRFGDTEQSLLATTDKSFGTWDLNVGLRRG